MFRCHIFWEFLSVPLRSERTGHWPILQEVLPTIPCFIFCFWSDLQLRYESRPSCHRTVVAVVGTLDAGLSHVVLMCSKKCSESEHGDMCKCFSAQPCQAFVASIVPKRSKSESPQHQQASLRLEGATAKPPMEMTFFQL